MIAKRGVPLLQAMLANEQRIREKTLQVEPHRESMNKTDRRNLDISEIIRHFYQQDRLNFTSTPRMSRSGWFDGDSSWPPESRPTEGRAIMAPNQSIYGIDFPDNFEEVFALAANYIT